IRQRVAGEEPVRVTERQNRVRRLLLDGEVGDGLWALSQRRTRIPFFPAVRGQENDQCEECGKKDRVIGRSGDRVIDRFPFNVSRFPARDAPSVYRTYRDRSSLRTRSVSAVRTSATSSRIVRPAFSGPAKEMSSRRRSRIVWSRRAPMFSRALLTRSASRAISRMASSENSSVTPSAARSARYCFKSAF